MKDKNIKQHTNLINLDKVLYSKVKKDLKFDRKMNHQLQTIKKINLEEIIPQKFVHIAVKNILAILL